LRFYGGGGDGDGGGGGGKFVIKSRNRLQHNPFWHAPARASPKASSFYCVCAASPPHHHHHHTTQRFLFLNRDDGREKNGNYRHLHIWQCELLLREFKQEGMEMAWEKDAVGGETEREKKKYGEVKWREIERELKWPANLFCHEYVAVQCM
jgi:hypothetical protein